MAGGVVVTPTVRIPEHELRWRFTRSPAPGGQHANTSDTRVSLSWDLEATTALTDTQRSRARRRLAGRLVDGVVTVTVSERRSQLQNRTLARRRLGALLARAIAPPPPPRRPTTPSRAARQRRLDAKRHRAEVKRLRQRRRDD